MGKREERERKGKRGRQSEMVGNRVDCNRTILWNGY